MYFYLSSIILTATALWVWRHHSEWDRLSTTLFSLAAFQLVLGLLDAVWQLSLGATVVAQLSAWAGLLSMLHWPWRWQLGLLGGFLALALLPTSPGMMLLTWGWITAVPLLVWQKVQAGQRLNIPIIAPNVRQASLRAVQVNGPITPKMIESQWPLLECLTSGVLFSGSSGLVEYANQAAAIIINEELDNIVGKPVTDLLTRLPMLGGGGESDIFEMNGRYVAGQMQIVYGRSGEAQGTVAVLQDVTSEQQAKKTRDSFLTTVSHELRTPLTAIKGYVELLNSGVAGSLSPSQQTVVGTIERNVKRMVQLINSLLFATSVRGGKLEYGAGETDLTAVVSQVVREMQPRAAAVKQQIVAEIPADMPSIQADPMHVMTILEELVLNGINYNQANGQVQITAYIENDLENKQQFAVVSVSDEGIGIGLAEQPHIFDEFYRLDQNDKQVRAGGLGLGLPIVRALVEAYNGRILFDSMPDEGSVFTVILPTIRNASASAASSELEMVI